MRSEAFDLKNALRAVSARMRGIFQPMETLTQAQKKIAAGDFDTSRAAILKQIQSTPFDYEQ
jgi:hypothetical protein